MEDWNPEGKDRSREAEVLFRLLRGDQEFSCSHFFPHRWDEGSTGHSCREALQMLGSFYVSLSSQGLVLGDRILTMAV